MNRQGTTLLITKPQYNKPFRNFSYHISAALAWPYRIFFNLITTSHCHPSLLKSLGSSMKTGSPLVISVWSNAFLDSILWLCKPIIHFKINIGPAVAHCTTWEFSFRVSGYSLFWEFPLTQYPAFNFLIFQSGFLLDFKYYVPGITLWSKNDFPKIIFRVSLIVRLWASSSIVLKCYSGFSPDKASIYIGASVSWLWYLIT